MMPIKKAVAKQRAVLRVVSLMPQANIDSIARLAKVNPLYAASVLCEARQLRRQQQ
jgi:hypothetical protein